MSLFQDNDNLLIINNKKKVNNRLKFFIQKFFSLKEYHEVYFYGPFLNIFGEKPNFNMSMINDLEPSSWINDKLTNINKNKILIVNKKLNESDLSVIKCLLETKYIFMDLLLVSNDKDNSDFLSSDFYEWKTVKVIEKSKNIKSDDEYDFYLNHIYDN